MQREEQVRRAGRISTAGRSAIMRRIRKKNTSPELAVRRVAYGLGFRYRIHRGDLPGTPDLVFGPQRKVIFVHGCFWHQHAGCRAGKMPRINVGYWAPKLARNQERDTAAIAALEDTGWEVMVVWECEVGDTEQLEQRLRGFLEPRRE